MKNIINVEKLGVIPYQQAWDMQNKLAEKIARGEAPQTLLLLQHPHTYTLGRRGDAQHLLWSEGVRQSKGVGVIWVDRGGDVTYHGPGQLVGYPLLRLAPIGWQGDRLPGADYVGYLRKLETVLIDTLVAFGLSGFWVDGKTGVWVSPKGTDDIKKIASIGVKVDSKGVSRHGFALNINPDMSYWEGIVPCGLEGVAMVSMADLLKEEVAIDSVQNVLIVYFGKTFDLKLMSEAKPQSY